MLFVTVNLKNIKKNNGILDHDIGDINNLRIKENQLII